MQSPRARTAKDKGKLEVVGVFAPKTEDELARAAAEGLLEESHTLDIKSSISSGPGANKELARDLASFAIDGGTYIVGVDETTAPPSLVPVPLDGLAERVEQVALARVDAPLAVRSTVIRASTNPSHGYLVVVIPPSPMAPHMVDGRYWGRNDKTKYQLSDAGVTRLIERRRQWEQSASEALDRAVADDPTPTEVRKHAHVFLVGRPVPSQPQLALGLFHVGEWQRRLLKKISEWVRLAPVNPDGPDGFAPHLGQATQPERRPQGWALSTYAFQHGRLVDSGADEGGLIELEIDEDGSLRAFCGRGSDYRHGRSGRDLSDETRVFFERIVVGVTHQFLGVARGLSEATAFIGSWDFGLAVVNMAGTVSWEGSQAFVSMPATYGGRTYQSTTRATVVELEQRPQSVAERLAGRLCRAFRVDEHPKIKPLLSPPDGQP